jgi:hypothetical protein
MTASIRPAPFEPAFVVLGVALPTRHGAALAPPAETPRGVTLTLAEYNRLLDLRARAPATAAAPPPAVLGAAD